MITGSLLGDRDELVIHGVIEEVKAYE